MSDSRFEIAIGDSPVVACAVHAGHELRPEIMALTALDDAERLREEDPFTGDLAKLAPSYLIARRSRYEVDLNRARERAVYVDESDAWGSRPWLAPLDPDVIECSLEGWDAFYRLLHGAIDELLARHQALLVLDVHSYNHRRGGPVAEPDNPLGNPEVNLGTGSLDEGLWRPVADAFLERFRTADYDCRENVKFRGGHVVQRLHEAYPGRVCALAIEFRKDYMDEWSGALHPAGFERLAATFTESLPALAFALDSAVASV